MVISKNHFKSSDSFHKDGCPTEQLKFWHTLSLFTAKDGEPLALQHRAETSAWQECWS